MFRGLGGEKRGRGQGGRGGWMGLIVMQLLEGDGGRCWWAGLVGFRDWDNERGRTGRGFRQFETNGVQIIIWVCLKLAKGKTPL